MSASTPWFNPTCFNPRLPHGRRLDISEQPNWVECFNPRLPHGRRLEYIYDPVSDEAFQSTPPAREATSPRLPHGRRPVHASRT